MNQSSQISTVKTNFGFDKKTNMTYKEAKQQQPNDIKISILSENIKKGLNTTENKLFKTKSGVLLSPIKDSSQFNNEMKKLDNIQKTKGKISVNNHHISEHFFEHDNKQTNKNKYHKNPIVNLAKDKYKEESTPSQINNNLNKFNLFNHNLNQKPIHDMFEKIKNINSLNASIPNKSKEIIIKNPKIKITISNESSDKMINSQELGKGNGNNFGLDALNDFNGNNFNININSKITNFYNMINMPGAFDERQNVNKRNKDKIQHKVGLNKSNHDSGFSRILNEEKFKEKGIIHENLMNNKDKFIYEEEVSKHGLKSS